MRSRFKQNEARAPQEDASVSTRRSERLARMKAGQRRTGVLAISLASAGVLLLAAVGIAMASGAAKAPADEPAASAPVSAPAIAAEAAPIVTPDGAAGGRPVDAPAEVTPAEPVDPPPADKAVPEPLAKPADEPATKSVSPPKQRYKIDIGGSGYVPSLITASPESAITLTVGQGDGCAAGFAIPSLGIEKDNSGGPVTFSLGRLNAGTYVYSCSMGMIEGKLVVK